MTGARAVPCCSRANYPPRSLAHRDRRPSVADAILDRLVHNAHTTRLKGESMRKVRGNLKPNVIQ
jgi:DNA replication protein DnaC